jgi:anti-anti-sigma factor
MKQLEEVAPMRIANGKKLELSGQFDRGACIVRLFGAEYGSLDAERLARVHSLLLDLVSDQGALSLVLDIANVQYFGAGFVSVLVDIWDRLRHQGGRLALCGLTPYCLKLVRSLHLDKLFDLYASQGAALENMGQHIRGGDERAERTPVRIQLSEVAWDPDMVRVEYIGDDDVPIRSVVQPRQGLNSASRRAIYG